MKFVVNRDLFNEAVSFVVKLLPTNPTSPILSGVVLHAAGSSLSLSSFDYEVSTRTQIDAEVADEGTVLVPGRLLADIASRLPDAPIEFERGEHGVAMRCGRSLFNLPVMPIEEFPSLPVVEGPSGDVSGRDFAEAVGQVCVAASKDDVSPVITGVNLVLDGASIEFWATDRYRVAKRELGWSSQFSEARRALVPAKTLSDVGKTLASAETITITLVTNGERELIAFSAMGRTVTSLLIKGNFPPVEKLLPNAYDIAHNAVLSVSDVQGAVRRMQVMLDRDAALRFDFTQDGVTLSASGGDQTQSQEEIDVVLHGDDTVISLKPQFLLEGVGSLHSPFVRIAFTNTENPNRPGPVLLTAQTSADKEGEDSFRYLLQPNLLMR